MPIPVHYRHMRYKIIVIIISLGIEPGSRPKLLVKQNTKRLRWYLISGVNLN